MHWMGFRKSDQERSTGYLEISKNLGREGGSPPSQGGRAGGEVLVGRRSRPKKNINANRFNIVIGHYPTFSGGVSCVSRHHFETINGFSNKSDS